MEMPRPNPVVLSLKDRLVSRLKQVLPEDAVIHDEAETRAYECDALTAYKCPPLLAVLPSSTREVSDVLRICHEEGVPVVPRGAGTSLAGGALPTADSVILGVARMNEVLETDYENRFIRVQTGRTNLSVTGAVEEQDFFYAPDPSSQLACAIAGNIAMNSGGAHCLKYGVTTNNLLGVTAVMMDGTVVEIGGAHLDAGGLDLLGLICGSEGQLAVVTEATLRILRKPEGARPVLMGYDSSEVAVVNGNTTIAGGVLKRSGANTVEVAKAVIERVELVKEELPPGLEVVVINDSSEFIVRMIGNLQRTVGLGGVLVLFVTLLFLGRLRPSMIVAISIPASMIIAFLVMFVSGYTINAITLMAMSLGIGMVVDNAIVVLENITRFVDEGVPPHEAADQGASEVGAAILASTLTTVVIFAPMIFVSGLVGIMFGQLAVIMIVTIGASLFVALTLTPMLAARWVQKQEAQKEPLLNRMLVRVEGWYGTVLEGALRFSGVSLALAVAISAATICLLGVLGTDFLPDQDSGELRLTVELPVGTNVHETAELARRIGDVLRAQPEVRMVFERSGTSEGGFGSIMGSKEGSNVTTISARMVPLSERSRSSKEIGRAVLEELGPVPQALNVELSAGMMMGQMLGMGAKPVSIEILGSDFAIMESVAEDLVRQIEAVPGTIDVSADLLQTRPEIRFDISKELAGRAAVPFALGAGELRTAMTGTVASRYTGGSSPRDVVVRLRDEDRDDVGDLGRIPVRSMTGQLLSLGDIGGTAEGSVPIEIKRVDKSRMITVSSAIQGRSLGDVAADVDEILATLEVPGGVGVRYAGSVEEQRESFADLFQLLMLGFVLVYLVMAAQFESWISPFVIMFSIPFAITGALFALLITGTTLSVTGFLGLIILLGIVVNNAIVLVDYVQQLEERGFERAEALVTAGRRRLRPVLMTTLTTMGGMLPMALARGDGAEMWGPMGKTAFGGLLVSTVVTLVLLPVIYSVTFRVRDRFAAILGRRSVVSNEPTEPAATG